MVVATVLQSLGIIATLIVSIWTLRESQKDSEKQSFVGIMVHKRSVRLDLLRRYSSQIITYSKCLLVKTSDIGLLREKLISAAQSFISLLQNQYKHDIELIRLAKEIENTLLSNAELSDDDVKEVHRTVETFWKKCDLYIGTEHERLKMESSGAIPGSGDVVAEENNFNDIYQKLEEKPS